MTLERTLSRGDWFLAVFNDDDATARTLRTVIHERKWGEQLPPAAAAPKRRQQQQQQAKAAAGGAGTGCPMDCHGRGECLEGGRCKCQPQYQGKDCSVSKYYYS